MTLLIYEPLVWQAAAAIILITLTTWVIFKRSSSKDKTHDNDTKPSSTSSSSSVPVAPTTSATASPLRATPSTAPSSGGAVVVAPKMKMLLRLLSSSGMVPLTDRIISDGHHLYESCQHIWNGMIDTKKPLAFVRVTDTTDVINTVKYAVERKLPISVKGGGHNIAGTALVHGGVVIDMHYMRSVHVDSKTSLVTVGGGCTWSSLDRECSLHGLAVVGGLISSTGVIGLAIGGGIGWLSRTYGLACDSIVSVDIVLASGVVITATAENEYSDLFWCHHGGGGNFGVVTSVTFRAHRLTPVRIPDIPQPPSPISPTSIASSQTVSVSESKSPSTRRSFTGSEEEYNAPVGYACLQWPTMNVDLLIAFDALAASLPSTVAAYCFLQRFPGGSGSGNGSGKSGDHKSGWPYHTVMMFVNNHGMMDGEKEKYTHHDTSILESQLVTLLGDLISAHPPRTMDISVMEYTHVCYLIVVHSNLQSILSLR
jgi:hypothetical protein